MSHPRQADRVDRGTNRASLLSARSRSVDSVDNRNDIREFLISRRAKTTPEQAGLPAYGNKRRVPGLRREEAAMLAGISVEYYTRLERGNATGVSEDVLEGLARALQLDEAEHAHLFDLVRSANVTRPARRPTQERVRPSVQRILDAMTEVPAYVRNQRLDTLCNSTDPKVRTARPGGAPGRTRTSDRLLRRHWGLNAVLSRDFAGISQRNGHS